MNNREPEESGDRVRADSRISTRSLQQRALNGSIWTAVYTISAVPVSFAANVVVARALGVSEFGFLATLMVLYSLTTHVANAGFSDSLVQHASATEALGQKDLTDGLLKKSLGFHILFQFPVLIVCGLAILHEAGALQIAAYVCATAAACLLGGAALWLTISNNSGSAAKWLMFINLVEQGSVATVALNTGDASDVLVTRVLVSSVTSGLLFISVPRERWRALLTPRIPSRMPDHFYRFAAQVSFAGLMGMLVFSRTEIFLLGWLQSVESAGLFALAFGLSVQLLAPIDSMVNPLLPAVSSLMNAHPERSNAAFLRILKFASTICGALIAGVVPLLVAIVPVIYGESFASTAQLVAPLAMVSGLTSLGHAVTVFTYARRHGGQLLRANAFALTCNLGAAIPLILLLGIWGAVIANALGQVAYTAYLLRVEMTNSGLSFTSVCRAVEPWLISLPIVSTAVAFVSITPTSETAPVRTGLIASLFAVVALSVASRLRRVNLSSEDCDALLQGAPRKLRPVIHLIARIF